MTYRNGMEVSCETIAPELRNVPNSTLQREKGQNPIYILSWWALLGSGFLRKPCFAGVASEKEMQTFLLHSAPGSREPLVLTQ